MKTFCFHNKTIQTLKRESFDHFLAEICIKTAFALKISTICGSDGHVIELWPPSRRVRAELVDEAAPEHRQKHLRLVVVPEHR